MSFSKTSLRLAQERHSDTPTPPRLRHVSRRMSEPVALGADLIKTRSPRHLVSNNNKPIGPGLQLTDAQKLLLRVSWSHANKRGSNSIGSFIMTKMFEATPETKDCLGLKKVTKSLIPYQNQYVHHSSAIVSLLNQILSGLESEDHTDLLEVVRDVGRTHANGASGRGFRTAFWDDFAVAVIESAIQWEGPGKKSETIKAWRLLMSQVTSELRDGYDSEVRIMRRRSGSLPSGH